MLPITILSRDIQTSSFTPEIWRFHISNSDASSISSWHYGLVIDTSGPTNIHPSLTAYPWSELYTSSTSDPFNVLWGVADNGSGDWSINFIKPYGMDATFDQIGDWGNFVWNGLTGSTSSGATGSTGATGATGATGSTPIPITFSNNDFILARSPYYINYAATASSYDYCIINLSIWTGSVTASTVSASYSLTAYKAMSSDTNLYLDISDYIKGYLNPILDYSWIDEPLDNYISNETCFVKWTLKSYKITSGYGVLSETRISNTKVATLGYGYHEDGINPIPPSNVLVDSTVNYSVGYTLYDTYINNSVVNVSSDVIKRIPSSSSSKLLRTDEHRFFEIVFLNKYGVFDSFIFNRASKRIINITSDKYQFLQNTPNSYNPNIATNRIQNSNGVEQWTLNTDLLDETQNERLQQLMLSDRWWLLDHLRVLVIPVNLTDKTFTEKLGLYDRVKIQWTLKFESANNKINDIR